MFREGNVVSKNISKSLVSTLAFEWGCAEKHFVD